ncbi:receptor family ligand binding region domain-containing protein [Ditylenchus destructor]|uniref:Receptor family ligand binding region domain-containing protein n=1 Tax=Ditylenchus destructor TaxID=166010 RepID=A0AAD4N8B4_9BILA|nr:receptor family ligand binding region domain-containing protein [Ditylenchus destructor]
MGQNLNDLSRKYFPFRTYQPKLLTFGLHFALICCLLHFTCVTSANLDTHHRWRMSFGPNGESNRHRPHLKEHATPAPTWEDPAEENVENLSSVSTLHYRTSNEPTLRTPTRAMAKRSKFEVNVAHPIHILFPLPTEAGRKEVNPFDITIALARPVVDEAIVEVYRRELVPPNSLSIHFEDSKLSDAHGPNVAINQLVDNRLDCIIGYAFVYALAPVARMSPYWRDKDSVGIPVITSVGLTSNLDNRKEYQLMTRISSPYKVVTKAVLALFRGLNLRRVSYVFHDQKHDPPNPTLPYGECYLLMTSLQPHLHALNHMQHNYFIFNELNTNRQRMADNLRKASMHANGGL